MKSRKPGIPNLRIILSALLSATLGVGCTSSSSHSDVSQTSSLSGQSGEESLNDFESGSTDSELTLNPPTQGRDSDTRKEFDSMKTTYYDPIPAQIEDLSAEMTTPAKQSGTLEELYYDTWESETYQQKATPLRKRAIVYLPYGWDRTTPLDVFFMMYGGWSDETTLLGTPDHPSTLKNAIDHAMENGQMKPMILVCPTYNNLSDKDSWDYGLALRLTDNYHHELTNDLMPALCKTYATYGKSGSQQELQDSREHWSFGGFSMGSVATWHIFEHALAYFSNFLPMSGNAGMSGSQMAARVSAQGFTASDFMIYGITGTKDFAAQGFVSQLQSLADAWPTFEYTDDGLNGNLALRVKDGFEHNQEAMYTYFYNGLKWYGQKTETEDHGDFTLNTTISEVMHDPAFKGFGRLLFPVNPGYMSGTTLQDLNLAWYSEINPDTTVEILNYMKEQVLDDQQIFYPIYTEEEMDQNPDLRNTGLFFFRGIENSPFAVVNSGGGFAYVAAMHDSFPHCLELSKMGINAFALIYRPGAQTACEDLSRALEFIFDHASGLQVNTDGYSLWGGSAGGRMTAWVSEMGTAAFGARSLPKPAADIIQYTGLQEVSAQDVPTWMIVGTNDSIASYRVMEDRSRKLNRLGIDSKIRVVPGLRHGFGLGIHTAAEGWVKEAVQFWMDHRSSR